MQDSSDLLGRVLLCQFVDIFLGVDDVGEVLIGSWLGLRVSHPPSRSLRDVFLGKKPFSMYGTLPDLSLKENRHFFNNR